MTSISSECEDHLWRPLPSRLTQSTIWCLQAVNVVLPTCLQRLRLTKLTRPEAIMWHLLHQMSSRTVCDSTQILSLQMLLKQQLWQLEYTVALKKWLGKPHLLGNVCSTANSSHSEQKHDSVFTWRHLKYSCNAPRQSTGPLGMWWIPCRPPWDKNVAAEDPCCCKFSAFWKLWPVSENWTQMTESSSQRLS